VQKRTLSRSRLTKVAVPFTALALLASGCGSDDDEAKATPQTVLAAYAEGVHAEYQASLISAKIMDASIDAFVATPTQGNLDDAKMKWLSARDDYGYTEAFRFYAGPIDNEETGKEGQINAWPLDEQYVDYVDGNATAGIVNNPTAYPEITAEVISEANEKDGEANISTGWHAIEFLLWGQDKSEIAPGNRAFTDYTSAPNADRRKTYLSTASDLLITDLTELVAAWAPDQNNFRKDFLAADPNESLRKMITGIGELSRGELAGERMTVAFQERSQEDEHSCFSDNTTSDIIANAVGIQKVVLGQYKTGQTSLGLADLVATKDKALAQRLRDEVAASVASAKTIPAPFDQNLREGVADDAPGRVAIQKTTDDLSKQTDTIVEAATKLGVTIEVS
jgi:putative iron-regulated protein